MNIKQTPTEAIIKQTNHWLESNELEDLIYYAKLDELIHSGGLKWQSMTFAELERIEKIVGF